jgi:hypothetical protein
MSRRRRNGFELRISCFGFPSSRRYFSIDPDSDIQAPVPSQRKLIFNRTITLKDTWAKIEGKQK